MFWGAIRREEMEFNEDKVRGLAPKYEYLNTSFDLRKASVSQYCRDAA
jgi:hypothetical protein